MQDHIEHFRIGLNILRKLAKDLKCTFAQESITCTW